jgi:hypothetical protein
MRIPRRSADRVGDQLLPSARVQFGDQGIYYREEVASIDVRALRASRLSDSVP